MRSVRFDASLADINFGARVTQAPLAQSVIVLMYPLGAGKGGSFAATFARTSSGGVDGPRAFIEHNAASPRYTFGGDSTGVLGSPQRTSANGSIVYNQWQHVAGTWDGTLTGSTGIKIYIGQKGAPLAETASYSATFDGTGTAGSGSTKNLHLGTREGLDVTFNGDIAYVAQWNRALTLTELLKAQYFGPLSVRGGLVLYWDGERDLGPYSMKSSNIFLQPGFEIPPQFCPVRLRRNYAAAAAAGVFIKLVGDNFRLAGGGGLAG